MGGGRTVSICPHWDAIPRLEGPEDRQVSPPATLLLCVQLLPFAFQAEGRPPAAHTQGCALRDARKKGPSG